MTKLFVAGKMLFFYLL